MSISLKKLENNHTVNKTITTNTGKGVRIFWTECSNFFKLFTGNTDEIAITWEPSHLEMNAQVGAPRLAGWKMKQNQWISNINSRNEQNIPPILATKLDNQTNQNREYKYGEMAKSHKWGIVTYTWWDCRALSSTSPEEINEQSKRSEINAAKAREHIDRERETREGGDGVPWGLLLTLGFVLAWNEQEEGESETALLI